MRISRRLSKSSNERASSWDSSGIRSKSGSGVERCLLQDRRDRKRVHKWSVRRTCQSKVVVVVRIGPVGPEVARAMHREKACTAHHKPHSEELSPAQPRRDDIPYLLHVPPYSFFFLSPVCLDDL